MNIGIICKYPIPYGMAATTRIFSYSKGLLECGDKVDVWSIAPNNFNANNNNEGVFNGIYGAQNEAYMSRSAEKLVRDLCFNELGVGG